MSKKNISAHLEFAKGHLKESENIRKNISLKRSEKLNSSGRTPGSVWQTLGTAVQLANAISTVKYD